MLTDQLIEGLLIKDRKAIDFLVNNYQEMVIRTAFYFIGNLQDAEDLSQEVMLEVLRSVSRYRNQGSFRAWIYRITVNRSLDHLRKEKRRNIFLRFESLWNFSSDAEKKTSDYILVSDSYHEENERREQLENAVNSLPENQRTAFILSKYDDLSYKEISEVMGVSVSSVESLLFRAKKNLQLRLAGIYK